MPKVTGKNAVRRATRGYTNELGGCPLVAHRYSSSQREDTRGLFSTGDKYTGEFTALPAVTSFGLFQVNRARGRVANRHSLSFVDDPCGES